MPVRIAHISDLHFGMRGQNDVWRSLRRLLSSPPPGGAPDLRPHLVLVTGDIVDTPRLDWFKEARAELAAIQQNGVRCFLCPGNHDRHEQGTALEGLPGIVQKPAGFLRRWFTHTAPKEADAAPAPPAAHRISAHFDQQLAGMHLPVTGGRTERFKSSTSNVEWIVRLVGLDSSAEAKYFAQGHIAPESLDDLRAACRFSGRDEDAPDLVIVLIHHHLLPITANESSQQHLSSVRSGTLVLNNAGSVLEALVSAQADIVLHGHDHARHVARYGSFLDHGGEVIVVGAASATGADPERGCDTSRASFNLLELSDERNVSLREIRYEAGQWRPMALENQLLSARHIRRGRYFRRRPDAALPESRLERHFEFTPSRDIFIREICTNWAIENGEWTAFTSNWSGNPWFIGGEIKLASGSALAMERDVEMALVDSKERVHGMTQQVMPAGAANQYALSIEHEIMWVTGAVLSQDDLSRCAAATRGPFREKGMEYIGTTVTRGLESLTMALELPEGYAPKDMAFTVIAETKHGDQYELKELYDRLRVSGRRKITAAITIPYPLLDATYWIAWTPPIVPAVRAELDVCRRKLQAHAEVVVARMIAALSAAGFPETYTLGLYVADIQEGRLGFAAIADRGERPAPPLRVVPTANQNPFCMSHWGLPQIRNPKNPGRPDADELAAGLQSGENALCVVPLNVPMGDPTEAVGIVRIGLLSDCDIEMSSVLLRTVVAAAQVAAAGTLELLRD